MAYTIQSKDTLSGIAQQQGTTVAELQRLNPNITDPNKIYAGQSLNILDANKSSTVPDLSLHQPNAVDFSSIKATLDAMTQSIAGLALEKQKAGEIKMPESPQKKSLADSILKGAQAPAKTTSELIEERNQLESDFLASKGITKENFDLSASLGSQMASIAQQLRDMEIQETKEKDDIRQRTGGTIGLANAEISKVERDYLYKKAMVASTGASLAAQQAVIEGKIEKAQKSFTDAINYATTKERDQIDAVKWAIGYYQDEDRDTRTYLQQQYENLQKEQLQKKPELREIGGNLYQFTYDKDSNSFTSKLLKSGADTSTGEASLFDTFLNNALKENDPQTAAQLALAYANDLKVKISLGNLTKRANELKQSADAQIQATPEEVSQSWLGGLISGVQGLFGGGSQQQTPQINLSKAYGTGNLSEYPITQRLQQLIPVYKNSDWFGTWKPQLRNHLLKEGYSPEAIKQLKF